MAARETEAGGLRSIDELTAKLVEIIAPFVRYEHPQGRLALSVFATRPRAPHDASPLWSAASGTARVELPIPGGPASTLSIQPGRLVVEDGFATLRTRCRVENPAGAAGYAAEILDGIFGYVKHSQEAAPETSLDGGVLIWERPVNRCEVLLVLQRSFGRLLGGELGFRFVDDRIVLDMSDQDDPRWDTSGGSGIFDPWPFAVWLARRHVKLLRPALRVAIEPGRAARAAPKPRAAAKARSAKPAVKEKPASKAAPAPRKGRSALRKAPARRDG